MAELSDAVRDTRNSVILSGRGRDLRQPGIGPALANYAWQRLLLEHEAERLHITISDKELVDFIRSQAPFQKDGVYSPELYEKFVGEFRNVLHLPADSGVDPTVATKSVLESVFRNDLTTEAARKALFSSVRSSAGDVATQYEKYYGPISASVAVIDPKTFVARAQVTPAEIEAEYKAHPENPDYRTKEKRKVDYTLFLLTADQEKLPPAQKAATKDALGQKALDFALAFQPEPSATGESAPPPGFLAQAKKMGVAAATSGFFDADSAPAGVPPSPAFNNAAFALTKENPISKVVELDNGVAVLHLAEIQPSELRPLAEVKGDIAKQLQQTKGEQAAKDAATAEAGKLKEAIAKGTDFKTAATALGLKIETLPPFVPMNSQRADPADAGGRGRHTFPRGRAGLRSAAGAGWLAPPRTRRRARRGGSRGTGRLREAVPRRAGRGASRAGLHRLGELEEQAARHAQAAGARRVRRGGIAPLRSLAGEPSDSDRPHQ